jgi:hypothetical protein
VRGGWTLASIAGGLLGLACGRDAFTCSDDAECQGGPTSGTCVEGYCAFPSDVCGSGLQYGDHAGPASGTCVPVGGSDTDPGPGSTSGAATMTPTSLDDAPLDTSASASASASGTDGPLPGEVEFRDDELRGEFGAGTMRGVSWTGDRLALPANAQQGSFTSRVFDAGATAAWQTVEWQPDGPYGKPLPDGGAAEVGYLEGGVDMAANVLLMHLDGDDELVWTDGTDVLDSSGAESHGVVVAQNDTVPLVPGVFGTAIDDPWGARISIPTANAPALAFGEDDFTWALWARMNASCTTNHVYMGVDDSEGPIDQYAHLWLGCTDDDWAVCPGTVTNPRAGGTLRSIHQDQLDGGGYCSASAIDDDEWHHLAMVKQGHANSTLRLYVDGVLEYSGPASFAQPIEYPNDPDFGLGGFSRGTYPAEGVFDEAAIWRRALGPDEVAALHRRGVTSLRVAVRVCSEAECADEPPFGPLLSDPPHATGPGLSIPLVELPAGRYVQYRLELGGDEPALRSVTIRGMVQ